MTFPDLRHAFPHTAELIVHGHSTLQDIDFNPGCGYVSIDEARILYALACDFPGNWCEVGSHTGFSGAHIASAPDVHLYAIEPMFAVDDFAVRTAQNWLRAGVDEHVTFVPGYSYQWLPDCDVTFAGAFVDGDHSPGKPLEDAQLLLPLLHERAVVVFHDNIGQPVTEAIWWLLARGFQLREYDTMTRLAVCWRGDWTPYEDIP